MWKISKIFSILFAVAFAFQIFSCSAAATTFYVDDDGSGNYTTIQAALDDSVDGDTIIVRPGTYDENLDVDVSVTIKGSSGYPTVGEIIINRQSQIYGLTITGGVSFEQAGISCIIRNNKFDGCGVSIGISYMYGNQTITNNLFTGSPVGVSTFDSVLNRITGNTFQNCGVGIEFMWGAGNHVVTGNTFKNCDVGIKIIFDSATIYNNYFSNTVNLQIEDDYGIIQLNTTKTEGTNIIGGSYIGGNFWGSPSGDGFSQTHLDTNGDGIAEETYHVYENVIDYLPLVTPWVEPEPEPVLPVANFSTNVTIGNAPLSVLFTDLSQNASSRIWDFDNNGQPDSNALNPVYVYEVPGTYAVSLTVSNSNGTDTATAAITVLDEEIFILPVANFSTNVTIGNAPLSVLFTDLSQNASSMSWDVNNDGVEDSSEASFVYVYEVPGTYTVNLAVSNSNGTDTATAAITVLDEEIVILPVANFSTNVTSGYYPLSVLFTDLSQNASSRSWDVNGDGVEDSKEANFVYVYTSRGTYEAKLTVSNANGKDTETATIDVERKSSGGGSSGGGGGGSPEPAKNVKVKELAQVFIINGKAIKFEFTKNATCVVYVGFDAKKNAGKTTTIVEELKGKSSLVSVLPDGEVYKSFNVWVGNSGYATSKNLENPVICFKVEKSWLRNESIDQDSITLNRYGEEDKWEQLTTSLSDEDDTYLFFTSDVPGFSSFAITGASKGASESVTINETTLETRSAQDDGNESTGLNMSDEQDESTKFSGIPPVYGIISMLFLGLICVIIYITLPK